MPSKSCALPMPNPSLGCVKNLTLSPMWLLFLLESVDFNNYLTQFMSHLLASPIILIRGVEGWFIHTNHRPNNNYNLFYLIIYYCFKRKRG